ncbi:MAG: hypothetical protein Q7R47_04005 [Candidatus Diapherotrites archaeon]|nr:hypothetical protein [Candidatus Diapherotrites archaeon]
MPTAPRYRRAPSKGRVGWARGQALLIEFVGALFVFLVVFLFLQNIWPENFNRWKDETEQQTMLLRANQLASALVESPGYPTDWTTNTVESIGLASQKNVLDADKLAMFAGLTTADYNLTKHDLRFFEYDFLVQIDANTASLDQNIGMVPKPDQSVVTVRRIVVVGGENAVLQLSVFR